LCNKDQECCGDKCYDPNKFVCCNDYTLVCGKNNKGCLKKCKNYGGGGSGGSGGMDCSKAVANPPYFDKDMISIKKFYGVTVDGVPCDSYTIDSIYADEPAKSSSGDPCPDAKGLGTDTAYVRAQSLALGRKGNGRVYTIGFTAHKGSSSCSGYVTVGMGSADCVNDGHSYESCEDCNLYDW